MCGAAEDELRWVHPLCQPLDVTTNGPFVELADNSLMTIDSHGMRTSTDEGRTWSAAQPVVKVWQAGHRGGKSPLRFTWCSRSGAGGCLSQFRHLQLLLG